jgi:hypothetical protein
MGTNSTATADGGRISKCGGSSSCALYLQDKLSVLTLLSLGPRSCYAREKCCFESIWKLKDNLIFSFKRKELSATAFRSQLEEILDKTAATTHGFLRVLQYPIREKAGKDAARNDLSTANKMNPQ